MALNRTRTDPNGPKIYPPKSHPEFLSLKNFQYRTEDKDITSKKQKKWKLNVSGLK